MKYTGGFFSGLSKMEKIYKKFFQEAVAEYNFTPNEVSVLMFLYNNSPTFDTASDIVRFKGISKGLVARSVASLCKKGFLIAQRDDRDRRIIHLHLTDQCDDIRAKFSKSQQIFTEKIEKGIPKEYLEIIEKTVEVIGENIDKVLKGDDNS